MARAPTRATSTLAIPTPAMSMQAIPKQARLKLEPKAKQDSFDNVHYAARLGSATGAPFSVARSALVDTHGTYALIAVTAVVLSRLLRRKKKEKA